MKDKLGTYLIGCEFVHPINTSNMYGRRFVESVEVGTSGAVVTDQDGLTWDLSEQLLYPDDYSNPIPYKEWVKKINEQDVED